MNKAIITTNTMKLDANSVGALMDKSRRRRPRNRKVTGAVAAYGFVSWIGGTRRIICDEPINKGSSVYSTMAPYGTQLVST